MKIQIPLEGPVVSNPKILGGTPIIKGSRIPASLLFDLISRGYPLSVIQQEYPSLTPKNISAFFSLMSKHFDVPQENSL